MGIENFWVIALLIVVVPAFFWLRVKAYNKRKKSVSVCCPSCGTTQRLEKLRNYICRKCKYEVRYFGLDGAIKENVQYYQCMACGADNFKGVVTCTACGLANPKGM